MFHSLPDYLDWYVESCSVINKANAQDEILSECGYDLTMRRLLVELMEVYSPYRFVTEEQFLNIYKAVMSIYGEYNEPDDDMELSEIKKLSRETEGLMALYEGLFSSGQLCEPIRTKEMARRLGIHRNRLITIINQHKDTLPVEYAWKNTGERGDWRFDPMQIDNFKRWLMNRHKPREDADDSYDLSHMMTESGRIRYGTGPYATQTGPKAQAQAQAQAQAAQNSSPTSDSDP